MDIFKYLSSLVLCKPLFFLPCPPTLSHQDLSEYTEVKTLLAYMNFLKNFIVWETSAGAKF